MEYDYIPIRLSKMKNKSPNFGNDMEKPEYLCPVCEGIN